MNYQPGSKCFVKLKGYSPWPARINVLPDDVKVPRGKYPVFFYGTHEVSYVHVKDIFDFEINRDKYGKFKEKNQKFNDGITEIEYNSTIYQLGIDDRAIKFLAQFYDFDSTKLSDKSLLMDNQITDHQLPAISVTSRKRKHNSKEIKDKSEPEQKLMKIKETDKITQDEKFVKDEETVNSILKNENLEISIVLNDISMDIPLLTRLSESGSVYFEDAKNDKLKSEVLLIKQDEPSDIDINSFKSPIETSYNERPIRASAQRFNKNLKSMTKSLISSPKHKTKKSDVSLRIKKESEKNKKLEEKDNIIEGKRIIKTEICISSPNDDMCVDINQNQSSRSFFTNSVDNKVNNSDEINLRIVSKLSIIDKEIKRSLIVGQENHEECRKLMQNMLELSNLTLVMICRVPEIVVTIRKCRRYKKDDMIKVYASQIFQKFFQIYEKADLEEKIEAGTQLLKRDSDTCKSAQLLLDELFVIEKNPIAKNKLPPSLALSSPSSAHSFHSSANNTPLLTNDAPIDIPETGMTLDPDFININDLLKNGDLVLIDTYSYEDVNTNHYRKEIKDCNDEDMYKLLGV